MGKRIFFFSLLLILLPVCPLSVAAKAVTGKGHTSALMQGGNYARAIQLIHTELAHKPLTEQKRFILLRSLAMDREKQAMAGFHVDPKAAIQAYRVLHREFPGQFNGAALLWKIAWLNWQHRNLDRADAAAQTLLSEHPRSSDANKAALLHARFLLRNRRFPAARNVLLRYFGLNTDINSHEQREGLAWIATIDEAEGAKGEKRQAYRVMRKLMLQDPSLIKGDAVIYAAYIRLIDHFSTRRKVLLHANDFVRRYISTPEAPAVRLLLADTFARIGQTEKAKQLYGILMNRYRSRSIGKKAFMRRLMLTIRHHPDRLNETLKSLAGMARENQLSDIEAESWLDQARLLQGSGVRGQGSGPFYNPKLKTQHSKLKIIPGGRGKLALEKYALVATSEQPAFTSIARVEGQILLNKQLQKLLQRKSWLQAVVLWRRFPQLRSEKNQKLVFNIAQAYMRLMDFSDADALLDKLYLRSMDTIWGQRIMLEKARLWVERGDTDTVNKIMRWLSRHEQTLYRPDMLLIAAGAQISKGLTSAASQTLAGINPVDLTPVLDRTYWLTRANISTRLQRWHDAAKAWRHLATDSTGNGKWRALYAQADALIQGMDYQGAQEVLTHIPPVAHNSTWHFYLGLSAYRAGQWKLAKTQLSLLRDGKTETPAYALLARYMLDVRKIGELEDHLP